MKDLTTHRFAAWRKANSKTQAAVAEELDVSKSSVVKWENKQRTPRPGQQRAIELYTNGEVTPNDWVMVAA